MFLILITGPPGVGKSRAALELHDELGERGVPNAMVEIDEFARSYPPAELARTLARLDAVCRLIAEDGADLLLLTATVEDDAHGEAIERATGASDRLRVRLEARPDTLERRLRQREPAHWDGLDTLVATSRNLAISMTEVSADAVIDTEERTALEVALEIERLVPARARQLS